MWYVRFVLPFLALALVVRPLVEVAAAVEPLLRPTFFDWLGTNPLPRGIELVREAGSLEVRLFGVSCPTLRCETVASAFWPNREERLPSARV